MNELSKEIGRALIDYEKNINKEKIDGKKAVILIMAVNDIQRIVKREIENALTNQGVNKKEINQYLKNNGFPIII